MQDLPLPIVLMMGVNVCGRFMADHSDDPLVQFICPEEDLPLQIPYQLAIQWSSTSFGVVERIYFVAPHPEAAFCAGADFLRRMDESYNRTLAAAGVTGVQPHHFARVRSSFFFRPGISISRPVKDCTFADIVAALGMKHSTNHGRALNAWYILRH